MSDTVPITVTVQGIHLAGGAVREGKKWRLNTAKFPDVVEIHHDFVVGRQRLEKRLLPHVERRLREIGKTAEQVMAQQKRARA